MGIKACIAGTMINLIKNDVFGKFYFANYFYK